MPEILEIYGEKIPRGEHVMIDMSVAKLPSHTLIDIPIYVYRAKTDGPVLLLISGLHGDELNGVETLRRMIVDKTIIPEKGTVIAIPILNIYGFINYSRQVPDGKDVNRSFPGSAKGSLASRVAHLFMKEVFPHFDYAVDLHTGGATRANYPQVRCVFDDKEGMRMAEAFAPPVIVNSRLKPKTLRKEAAKAGKPLIVFEGGESLRFDESAITEAIAGTQRLMHRLKMRRKKPLTGKPKIVHKSKWLRARYSGLFRSSVTLGETVKHKQTLGKLTDPYGEMEFSVKVSDDGIVIGINNAAVVSQGDALFHIGIT